MLSIKPLKTSKQTTDYFTKQENYYTKNNEEEASFWFGKLMPRWEIQGHVKADLFEKMLEGMLPDGQQLGVKKLGKLLHRPGIDLTFTAPKSVSILWQLGKDDRLLTAHINAVKSTLAVIEKECMSARVFRNGVSEIEQTDNLIAACFSHDTSREFDPLLHTHCIILNMTQRSDNKIRALASQKSYYADKKGFCEQILSREKHFGLLYRIAFSHQITSLGYDIVLTHQDGRFEIAGVPKEVICAFSKRRQQIKTMLTEKGLTGGKASLTATLATRAQKTYLDKDTLMEKWQLEAKAFNFNAKEYVKQSYEKVEVLLPAKDSQSNLTSILNDSIAHLSEREAVFSQDAIYKAMVRYCLGKVKIQEIDNLIQAFCDKKWLVKANLENQTFYTTMRAIAIEKSNINLIREAKEAISPFLHSSQATEYLKEFNLTSHQEKAAHHILVTHDKVIGIQGYAGTGKTTLMKAIKAICDKEGIKITGIVSTAFATQKLQEESGIDSSTLASFIIEENKRQQQQNNSKADKSIASSLWVVDEASMLSSKEFNTLLKLNKKTNAHLVFIGDKAQLPAINAGKPFSQLQSVMSISKVEKIVRQKEGSLMHRVVEQTINKNIKSALDELNHTLYEIADKNERINHLCGLYLSLPKEVQKETLLITPVNEDRDKVNTIIHKAFQEEGRIDKVSYETRILASKGLTLSERKRVQNYQIGDIIRFNHSNKKLGIKRCAYYVISSIDKENNSLSLTQDNKVINWQPHRFLSRTRSGVEVFKEKVIQLAKGDTLRWTRNQNDKGFINARKANVVDITQDKISIQLEEGKRMVLDANLRQNQHFDYAYASTVYTAQGESATAVIAHEESFRKSLTHQKAFYVIVSRAKENASLLVDSKKHYLNQLEACSGEKTSSLEVLNQNINKDNSDNPPSSEFSSQNLNNQSKAFLKSYYDLKVIQEKLTDNAELIVEKVLGKPNASLSNPSNWRYGKKGSLSISMQGVNKGVWHSFETGESGHLLKLIEQYKGLSFIKACQWVDKVLGIEKDLVKNQDNKDFDKLFLSKEYSTHPTQEDKKAIEEAIKLWEKGIPLSDTLAEKYLKEHRQINLNQIPKEIKFLPNYYSKNTKALYSALIAKAADEKGNIQAVSLVLLDSNTGNKAQIVPNKIILGRLKFGASVRFNSNQEEVYIVEGIETALSILQAKPKAEVIATLSKSNFKNIKITNAKSITFCLDNDNNLNDIKKLIKDIDRLIDPTLELKWVMPDKTNSDFNDMLREKGKDFVSKYINKNRIDLRSDNKLFTNLYNVTHKNLPTFDEVFSDNVSKQKNFNEKLDQLFLKNENKFSKNNSLLDNFLD